jgi:PAS domain-containing protein
MSDSRLQTPDWLRQMESILEELNEGVVIVDDELRIIFANDALLRLGQYVGDELRGLPTRRNFPSRGYSLHYAAARIRAPLRPQSL